MSLWRQLARGLRVLANRTAADQDVADEVEHYLQEASAALEARGVSPDEARRAARLEVGNVTAVREEIRSYGWENIVDRLATDLRHSVRRLRDSPGFTTVGVITLGLGIGAITAIFSAIKPILLDPLPYPRADQIVAIWDVGRDHSTASVTFGTYREVIERSRSFDALAVMKPWQPALSGGAVPERLDGQRVTSRYFQVLGIRPALGRDFQPADDRVDGPDVVILSDGLWRRRFGADPSIVGRQIRLDDTPYTVAGIMPATFENVLAPSADAWALLQYDTSLPLDGREWGHHLRMVGRLTPDAEVDRARQELAAIAGSPVTAFARAPWASLANGLIVNALKDDVTRHTRSALVAVTGAVVLLLAIACVNVTNLLLARGAQRRGELAMRAALGAGRSRLVQQLVTESVLLAFLGGIAGLVVASAGIRTLVALGPAGLPRLAAIAMDTNVFLFAFAVSAAIGIVMGIVPALHVLRQDIHARVDQMSERTVTGRQRARQALVVVQVALALVLLVTAGLLFRSVQRLLAINPGFDAAPVLTMQVQASGRRFDDDGATHRFFANALDAVRAVPGVTGAAFTTQLPLSGDLDMYGVHLESEPGDNPDNDHSAFRYGVSPDYFQTMRIPLRHGRLLNSHDSTRAPLAVVIAESMARRRFVGRDPIGQRIHVGATDRPWYTVVGVVGDVRQTSLAVGEGAAVYVASEQWPYADRTRWLVIRAKGEPAALAPVVQRAIWHVDKDLPIVRVAPMSRLVARSEAERRFAMILFEAFGLVALVLAATGIYGLIAGSVTERTREIGVRAALGASRRAILGLVMGQGLSLVLIGIAIGLGAAAAASRGLGTLLYGISQLDPLTYVTGTALLLVVAAIACGVPARRAASIDPAVTLRMD